LSIKDDDDYECEVDDDGRQGRTDHIRYDTIKEFNELTWTRKLSIQLNLAHVARN